MTSCLIVDDSRVIRKVARQIFETIGFACNEAENGKIALDICQQNLPDFVLLDWNMPVMNGLEFLQALRQLPDGGKPKVMFCTVEKNLARITSALDAGADEYVIKPFDADIISGKLAELDLLDI
jgi:two-component system chemotaxis response regulator CheY